MLSGKVSNDKNVAIVLPILHIFIKKTHRFQVEAIAQETNVVIFCFHLIFTYQLSGERVFKNGF